MMKNKIYRVSDSIKKTTLCTQKDYISLYKYSTDNPEGFWSEQAKKFISWYKPWHTTLDWDFNQGNIKWFQGAKLNVSYNCLDRHLQERGQQTAIIWEGDELNQSEHITYNDLHQRVCRFANALKSRGVEQGDRVAIYMPMIPEAAVAMLACTRIGAVHSVVFGGFSAEALRDRILDSDCRVVVTADQAPRGGKNTPLKSNVDHAIGDCPNVHTVFVVKRTGNEIAWHQQRDQWYHQACEAASEQCDALHMDAEDPLFILYTSGSTGKPKGVLHTSGGYLLQAAITHKYIFDYHDGDIYWCTADVGWVTGHTYIIYGPLANGATTLMFEGTPTYPDASRFWQIIDKHQVNIFYTAPTAIRALMRLGNETVETTSRNSLRILGSVGEPINPEAWEWYYHVIGKAKCPIVDTWWQTETGGILISPLPGATDLKPGSACLPFFGVQLALYDNEGHEIQGEGEGNLVIKFPWPGQMRSLFGNHQRFIETYFSGFDNVYTTGDGAKRDADGYYWITGRVDDVINVSGHRMGTAEIESALVLHQNVAEAAVVGYPHEIKGQGIYAYVTLMKSVQPTDKIKQELMNLIKEEIGSIAKPDVIQWAPKLPKTRSGKIMRRILRKISADDIETLGDTSTLAEPEVIDDLIENRQSLVSN